MYSQQEVSQSIYTRVVGVTFDNRQATIQQLTVGAVVALQREPDNPYDPNAIRVERTDGEQIGYIPRVLAAQITHVWDVQGITSVPAIVTALTGGYSQWASRGVQIKFSRI